MHVAEVVALGYRYPNPTSAADLATAIEPLHGVVERHMRRFVEQVAALDLGAWEELHTATLDLSPQFIPYVGHVIWGESYRRGEFMAELKVSMAAAGVELRGELPDHIEPVLRYLASTDEPLPDLVEVLPGAVVTMQDTLKEASPRNPYRQLLAATAGFTADLRPVTIGGHL